jgi:hypothetical protein
MLKHLIAITALAIGSVTAAHATPITGYFSAFGGDSFSSSDLEFNSGATVQPAIGGTFATYLTAGNPITFATGLIPYVNGENTPPAIPIFSTTEAGETFTFTIASFNADYFVGTASTPGCTTGNICLTITGVGTFTGTGAVDYTPSTADFQFSSQYAAGTPNGIGEDTTFSASTVAAGSPIPEPASLALFGTGLLGVLGIARRKFNV